MIVKTQYALSNKKPTYNVELWAAEGRVNVLDITVPSERLLLYLEYNDEAVDSMVTILGLSKTINELQAELESPLTSNEKKKQIEKQLKRIQTQEYKDSIKDVSFVPNYDDNSLKLNNNNDNDKEIIVIEKETVIRNGG